MIYSIHDNERSFTVHQDITTLYGYGPNQNWKHTDKDGHEHYYENGYPTLVEKKELINCDCCDENHDYCEGYYNSWYECSICGEVIKPTSTYQSFHVPGRIHYRIDDVLVTKEEFEKQLALTSEVKKDG